MALDGLEVQKDPLGRYSLARPDGSTAFEIAPLTVTDSNRNASGGPVSCSDAKMTIATDGNGDAIVTYEVPRSFIDDPARVFPIMVDPTLTDRDPTIDAYVSSVNGYNGTGSELKCGYYDSSTGHNRSYVKFTWNTQAIPAKSYVSGADLQLWLNHQYYVYDPTNVYFGKLTSSWGHLTTWGTRPSYTYQGTESVAGRNRAVNHEIGDVAQEWVDDYSTNFGMQVYQREDGSQNMTHWKRFWSSDYTGGVDYLPKLTIDSESPNTTGSGVDKTVYRVGDTVTARIKVGTLVPEDINCIEATLRGTGATGPQTKGVFQWTEEAPGPSWGDVVTDLPGVGGGYVSSRSLSGVTLLSAECVEGVPNDSSADNAEVVFKWRIDEDYGDVQDNDLDVVIRMDPQNGNETGNRWSSAVQAVECGFGLLPGSSSAASGTATGLSWLSARDADGDGLADPSDKPLLGRGYVDLSWDRAVPAAGYHIYAFDGGDYRLVGSTSGSSTTTWSSRGEGIYPADSAIAGYPANWDGNPFAHAVTPSAASRIQTLSVPVAGAGLVASDGSNLFVRRRAGGAGESRWRRFSITPTGTGEVALLDRGQVGPDFAAQDANSAFALDGFVYSGYATSPTSIAGIAVSASSVSTSTRTLTFTRPLLDPSTGASLTAASSAPLLASDGEHIYSVAYSRSARSVGALDGYRVRVFDREGVFETDSELVVPSEVLANVLATGGHLALIGAGSPARVTKVSTDSFAVTGAWKTGWGAGAFTGAAPDAPDGLIFMGARDSGTIISCLGPGLDLRDDANPLYTKTDGATFDARSDYSFRVVPYTGAGEATLDACPVVTLTLPDRTVGINDDPRHTTYDIGAMAGVDFTAVLDKAALRAEATDLEVAGFGPEASVGRTYDSALTTASAFAPGWRFGFEAHTETLAAGGVRVVDETGEHHDFLNAGGGYAPPAGYFRSLAQTQTTEYGACLALTSKDGSVDLFSAATGALLSSCDSHGSAVRYERDGAGRVTRIVAANGLAITLAWTGDALSSARYERGGVARTVDYSRVDSSTYETAYDTAKPELARRVRYIYTSSRLTAVSVVDASGTPLRLAGAEASSIFFFDATGSLASAAPPGVFGQPDRDVYFVYDRPARKATLTRTSKVGAPNTDEYDQLVTRTYAWNPTGTMREVTDWTSALDTVPLAWNYTYGSLGEVTQEKSPTGASISRGVDIHGNTLFTRDESGHLTTWVYDVLDRVVRTTDPLGSTTTYGYDGASRDVVSEERVVSDSGDKTCVRRTFDTVGRVLTEARLLQASGTMWLQDTYTYGPLFGAPVRVSELAASGTREGALSTVAAGVDLGCGASATSIETTFTLDSWGNTLARSVPSTGVASVPVQTDTYDALGYRVLRSNDASGVIQNTDYDVFGHAIRTWTSAPQTSTVTSLTERTIDPLGAVYQEKTYRAPGDVEGMVFYVRDPVGRAYTTDSTLVDGFSKAVYDARGNIV